LDLEDRCIAAVAWAKDPKMRVEEANPDGWIRKIGVSQPSLGQGPNEEANPGGWIREIGASLPSLWQRTKHACRSGARGWGGIGLTRGGASETRAFDDHGSFSTDLEHLGAPVSSLHVLPCCSRCSRSLEFPLDFQHSTFLLLLQAVESEDLRLVQVLVLVFGFLGFFDPYGSETFIIVITRS